MMKNTFISDDWRDWGQEEALSKLRNKCIDHRENLPKKDQGLVLHSFVMMFCESSSLVDV